MNLLRRLIAFFAAVTFAAPAFAGLIRDAEIEHALRAYATPIFVSADIPPEDVRILIVNDPTINAYVAGGLNIFIHTGIIRAADKPGMLIGVIAHETGHIAGAHLSQLAEKSSRSTLGSIIGAAVGLAAVAGGAGKAGAAVLMGSQNVAQRTFTSGIRLNEQSADQAALTFLDDNNISASGMLEMFESLRRQESARNQQSDPFLRDHPLTSERITAMRNHIQESSIPMDAVPSNFAAMHARVLAKLAGFTDSYEAVMSHYPVSDTSVAARYARAIAEFQRSNLPAALKGMDQLIKEYPKDAFFYDTKGQMLFENGRLAEAYKTYGEAARLQPDSALILTDYARCLTAQEDKPELLPRAVELLEKSRELDDSYDTTWRQLAIAYGRQGKMGPSYLALAEEAALQGQNETVLQHVARARQYAADDPALGLKLDDLERDAKAQLKHKNQHDLF
jgi:predicted Zn-dependent protease